MDKIKKERWTKWYKTVKKIADNIIWENSFQKDECISIATGTNVPDSAFITEAYASTALYNARLRLRRPRYYSWLKRFIWRILGKKDLYGFGYIVDPKRISLPKNSNWGLGIWGNSQPVPPKDEIRRKWFSMFFRINSEYAFTLNGLIRVFATYRGRILKRKNVDVENISISNPNDEDLEMFKTIKKCFDTDIHKEDIARIFLLFKSGFNYRQTSEILGISSGSIFNRLKRFRRLMELYNIPPSTIIRWIHWNI
jgi:hypothetical protein